MKKVIFIIILFIINSSIACKTGSDLSQWDDMIKKNAPERFINLRVIKKGDIKDNDNLEAFEKYNPKFIIIDDFNRDGKEEYFIPCRSQRGDKKWFVLIFEKENNIKYKFIQYFSFDFSSIYVIKQKGRDFSYIRVGESFASDYMINIYWDGKKFVKE